MCYAGKKDAACHCGEHMNQGGNMAALELGRYFMVGNEEYHACIEACVDCLIACDACGEACRRCAEDSRMMAKEMAA
jgi:hypothetical protein